MNESIDAPEIDERSEVLNLADDPFAHLPRLKLGQERLLRFLLLALQHGPPAENEIAAALVRLGHHAHELLPHEVAEVLDAVQRHLARGDEGPRAGHFAFEAAGVRAGDAGLDQRTLGHIGPFPRDNRRTGNRQVVEVVFRIETRHDHIDHVAHLRRLWFAGRRSKAAEARRSLVLAAEREEHVVAMHVRHLSPVPRFVLQPLGSLAARSSGNLVERQTAQGRGDLGFQILGLLAAIGHRHFRPRARFTAGLALDFQAPIDIGIFGLLFVLLAFAARRLGRPFAFATRRTLTCTLAARLCLLPLAGRHCLGTHFPDALPRPFISQCLARPPRELRQRTRCRSRCGLFGLLVPRLCLGTHFPEALPRQLGQRCTGRRIARHGKHQQNQGEILAPWMSSLAEVIRPHSRGKVPRLQFTSVYLRPQTGGRHGSTQHSLSFSSGRQMAPNRSKINKVTVELK